MPPPGGYVEVRRELCDKNGRGTDKNFVSFNIHNPKDLWDLFDSPPSNPSSPHAGYRYDVIPHLATSPPSKHTEVVGLSTVYHLTGDPTAHLVYLRTDHQRFRRQDRKMPFVGPRPPKSDIGLPDYSAPVRTLGRLQVEIVAWLAHRVHKASELQICITPGTVAGQEEPAWSGSPFDPKRPLPWNQQSDLKTPQNVFSGMSQFFESFGCEPAHFVFLWNDTKKRTGFWDLQTVVDFRNFRTHLIGKSRSPDRAHD
jgi:hypothetical protein